MKLVVGALILLGTIAAVIVSTITITFVRALREQRSRR